MTTDRIKSTGVLVATLLVGILLGLLVPAFYHNVSGRHRQEGPGQQGHSPERKGDWFVHTLYRIVEPDSLQKEKMKSVTSWANARLDSIEQSANSQASRVLDSVKNRLHPLMTDAQWSRLEKFDQDAKTKWHRHGRGH